MRIFFRPGMAPQPADLLSTGAIAHREVSKAVRLEVLAGSGLSAEMAEILIELSLPDNLDADGFIAFRDLKNALGYSAGLLSRRIGTLCDRQWTEAQRAVSDAIRGIHGNSQKVRITRHGRNKIAPVWQRYEKLAQRLLAGLSTQDLEAHYRVNYEVCRRLGMSQPQPLHDVALAATTQTEPADEFLD